MRILISGATGFVGSGLSSQLKEQGHEIFRLTRSAKSKADIEWSPREGKLDLRPLERLDGIIHLAGESIAGGFWTEEKKKKIYESRVQGTNLLVEKVLEMGTPPKFFVSASATGYYGSRGNEELDETSSAGEGFLAHVCGDWEKATQPLHQSTTRVVICRTGIVLQSEGGILEKMRTPFKLGLGGSVGSGEQWMSWIEYQDLIRAYEYVISNESCRGVFNFVSTAPIRQKDFASALAKALNRPHVLRAPKTLLKLAMGEMVDELLLASTRVYPKALEQAGFQFQYSNLDEVFRKYFS